MSETKDPTPEPEPGSDELTQDQKNELSDLNRLIIDLMKTIEIDNDKKRVEGRIKYTYKNEGIELDNIILENLNSAIRKMTKSSYKEILESSNKIKDELWKSFIVKQQELASKIKENMKVIENTIEKIDDKFKNKWSRIYDDLMDKKVKYDEELYGKNKKIKDFKDMNILKTRTLGDHLSNQLNSIIIKVNKLIKTDPIEIKETRELDLFDESVNIDVRISEANRKIKKTRKSLLVSHKLILAVDQKIIFPHKQFMIDLIHVNKLRMSTFRPLAISDTQNIPNILIKIQNEVIGEIRIIEQIILDKVTFLQKVGTNVSNLFEKTDIDFFKDLDHFKLFLSINKSIDLQNLEGYKSSIMNIDKFWNYIAKSQLGKRSILYKFKIFYRSNINKPIEQSRMNKLIGYQKALFFDQTPNNIFEKGLGNIIEAYKIKLYDSVGYDEKKNNMDTDSIVILQYLMRRYQIYALSKIKEILPEKLAKNISKQSFIKGYLRRLNEESKNLKNFYVNLYELDRKPKTLDHFDAEPYNKFMKIMRNLYMFKTKYIKTHLNLTGIDITDDITDDINNLEDEGLRKFVNLSEENKAELDTKYVTKEYDPKTENINNYIPSYTLDHINLDSRELLSYILYKYMEIYSNKYHYKMFIVDGLIKDMHNDNKMEQQNIINMLGDESNENPMSHLSFISNISPDYMKPFISEIIKLSEPLIKYAMINEIKTVFEIQETKIFDIFNQEINKIHDLLKPVYQRRFKELFNMDRILKDYRVSTFGGGSKYLRYIISRKY